MNAKYKEQICQNGKQKGQPHVPGEWEVLDKDPFKIRIRKCMFCGKKLNEKVIW